MIVLALLALTAQQPAVSATAGVLAEGYSIDGRAARRPAQSLRAYANPTFSWLGFEIGASFLWSTENDFTAQRLNRFYLNPRWSWGEAHLGDHVPSISRFTASAVTVRGAGFVLRPGKLRFAVSGGRSQDATDLSVFDAAPERMLVAGLVGYGDPASGTFVEISALRAADDASGTDTLSAAPQENLVAALAAGIRKGWLGLKAELSGSLYSRDIRAGELDSLSQPGFTESLFTPRLSSRVDKAWSIEARASARAGHIGVQVEEIGPGFTTLGNPFLANDKREVRAFGSWRAAQGRVVIAPAIGLRRDNLAGDKRATTNRRTGSLSMTVLSGAWLVSSVSVVWNGLTRDPAPLPPGSPDPGLADTFQLKNIARSIAWIEQARFRSGATAHTLGLTVTSQQVNDGSPRYGTALDATSTTLGLEYAVTLAERYSVSLRPGYQWFDAAGEDDAFASVGVVLARRAARSPWTASLGATFTQVGEGRQWRGDAMGSYRITPRDQAVFSLRYTTLGGVPRGFSETTASLRVTHRF
jgi:hypothetical protein